MIQDPSSRSETSIFRLITSLNILIFLERFVYSYLFDSAKNPFYAYDRNVYIFYDIYATTFSFVYREISNELMNASSDMYTYCASGGHRDFLGGTNLYRCVIIFTLDRSKESQYLSNPLTKNLFIYAYNRLLANYFQKRFLDLIPCAVGSETTIHIIFPSNSPEISGNADSSNMTLSNIGSSVVALL